MFVILARTSEINFHALVLDWWHDQLLVDSTVRQMEVRAGGGAEQFPCRTRDGSYGHARLGVPIIEMSFLAYMR